MGWVILIFILLLSRNKAAGAISPAGLGTGNPGTGVAVTVPASGYTPIPAPGFQTPTPVPMGGITDHVEIVNPIASRVTPIETVEDTLVSESSSAPSPVPLQVPGNYTIGTHTPPRIVALGVAPIDEPQLPLSVGATIDGGQKPFMTPTPQSELQGGRVFDF